MIVVPGVMGITVWSPPLDELGNSVRGVEFSKELVTAFNFHTYDIIAGGEHKNDPRIGAVRNDADRSLLLINAAAQGDVNELRRLLAEGTDVNKADYDVRRAVHLAACEGREAALQLLLDKGADINVKDRWGNTPLDDAKPCGGRGHGSAATTGPLATLEPSAGNAPSRGSETLPATTAPASATTRPATQRRRIRR
jgi:glutaminase